MLFSVADYNLGARGHEDVSNAILCVRTTLSHPVPSYNPLQQIDEMGDVLSPPRGH